MMRIGLIGCGAVGACAARQLLASDLVDEIVLFDPRADRAEALAIALGRRVRATTDPHHLDVDGVVLASAAGTHLEAAHRALRRGQFVVSTSDRLEEVQVLATLDAQARDRGVAVVLGAAFAPGFTCVLARFAAASFDEVDEIHVAKAGTGGPDCARQHHRAFRSQALDWHDGAWRQGRGGSGRELCWFPDPVGGRDCYRASLADPTLLLHAFPRAIRITARVAATRRDRLTMHLPMLRPPHADGGVGAVRVEVRGRLEGATKVVVYGAISRPAVGAGTLAAQTALWLLDGRIRASGAVGMGTLVDAKAFLRELGTRGLSCSVFDGRPREQPLPSPMSGNFG